MLKTGREFKNILKRLYQSQGCNLSSTEASLIWLKKKDWMYPSYLKILNLIRKSLEFQIGEFLKQLSVMSL